MGMLVLLCETGLCTRYNQNQPPPPLPPPPLRKEGKVEMNRFCGFVSDALLKTCAVAVASEGENWCFAVETTREY